MQRRSKSDLYELVFISLLIGIFNQAMQLNKENKLDKYIVNAMKNMDRFDIIFCKKTRKFNSGELKYY